MKKLIILMLLFAFCLQLAACGGKGETSSTPVPSSSELESWGAVADETPQTAAVTEEPENEFGTLSSEVLPQDDETIMELKQVVMAIVMCDYADGMQFDPADSMFFWRAMNYYAASVCYEMDALSEDMSWAVFSEEDILYFATRLFGGVEALPELLDVGMIEKWDTGEYAFMLGNYGDVLMELGDIAPEGEGFRVEATLVSGEEGPLGSWIVNLTQIDGEYCVTGIVYG